MNIKHFLSACALALPLCASAVPAYPGLMKRTLSDGSTVNVRLHGDEYFSYLTDENGFLLESRGGLVVDYKLDSNGARMSATPILLESLRAESFAALPVEMRRAAENQGPQRIAAHDYMGRTTFPTVGENHFLVVLIEFADRKWSVDDPVEVMNQKLNGENYDYNGSLYSMREFYRHNSNGLFVPTFDIVGPVTLPKTSEYYTGGEKYTNVKEAVTYAAQAVDDIVDYTKYDIDNDGTIDNIIFFYAGYGQADTGDKTCLWPHNNSSGNISGVTLDGKKFNPYCCFNELNGGTHYYSKDGALDGIGTPVHEFNHVMGLPDLYDPRYEVLATPGKWSIMDQGCYNNDGYVPCNLSGYERWCFRWIEYEELSAPGTYELEPLSRNGAVKRINLYDNNDNLLRDEYFLIEGRHNEDADLYLPNGGLLIWHIDYDRNTFQQNRVNSVPSRMRVQVVTSDGSASYDLGNMSTTANAAAWPGQHNYITPDTEITLRQNFLLRRGPIDHYFSDMAYDKETGKCSFDFDVVRESPTFTTVMHQPVRLTDSNDRVTRTVRFEWDEVPEADSYEFTLYRINSQGDVVYEAALKDFNIGNVTHYDYTYTNNKMNIEYRVFVRPVKVIPSLEKSNEVVFKPGELATSGIDDIVASELPVRGLKGAIDAPANARIFTVAGAPAPRTGLTPGLYLVNVDGKTYKVVVK